MKAKEFDKKLEQMLCDDILLVSEIIENVRQMREAYRKAEMKRIIDELSPQNESQDEIIRDLKKLLEQ